MLIKKHIILESNQEWLSKKMAKLLVLKIGPMVYSK
jgi:hypothetical protein